MLRYEFPKQSVASLVGCAKVRSVCKDVMLAEEEGFIDFSYH